MIKETIAKFLKLDGLIGNLTGYFEARIELLKVELKEDLISSLSKALLAAVLLLGVLFFILFASVAAGFLLAQAVGYAGGFAIVAGFYLLTSIILVLLRKNIRESLEKKMMEFINTKKR